MTIIRIWDLTKLLAGNLSVILVIETVIQNVNTQLPDPLYTKPSREASSTILRQLMTLNPSKTRELRYARHAPPYIHPPQQVVMTPLLDGCPYILTLDGCILQLQIEISSPQQQPRAATVSKGQHTIHYPKALSKPMKSQYRHLESQVPVFDWVDGSSDGCGDDWVALAVSISASTI